MVCFDDGGVLEIFMMGVKTIFIFWSIVSFLQKFGKFLVNVHIYSKVLILRMASLSTL